MRFYELLDDVVETHQMARLLPDDPDGRENIVEEVIKLVVPSLRRFIQKNKEKEFSKSECGVRFFIVMWVLTIPHMAARPTEV